MSFLWSSIQYSELAMAKPCNHSEKILLHVQNYKPISKIGKKTTSTFLLKHKYLCLERLSHYLLQKCVNQSGLGEGGEIWQLESLLLYLKGEGKGKQRLRNRAPYWLLCHPTPAAQGILAIPLSRGRKPRGRKKFVGKMYTAQLTCFFDT